MQRAVFAAAREIPDAGDTPRGRRLRQAVPITQIKFWPLAL
jgi:hypothetical protein